MRSSCVIHNSPLFHCLTLQGKKQLCLVTFDDSPADDVTQYDVCSGSSLDFDGTAITDEASVSMQPVATSTHTDGSSDYSHVWMAGTRAGCDLLPLEYSWDGSTTAQTSPCRHVDVWSDFGGSQIPHMGVAIYTTTAMTGVGYRTVVSSATSGTIIPTCLPVVFNEEVVGTSHARP